MSELAQIRTDLNALLDRIEAENRSRAQARTSAKRGYIELYLASIRHRYSVASDVAECGWDIMLDLYKHEGRKRITVSSACIGSLHPQTTALRHISVLLEQGFIERETNPEDARQVFLNVTSKGRSAVDDWLRLMAQGD